MEVSEEKNPEPPTPQPGPESAPVSDPFPAFDPPDSITETAERHNYASFCRILAEVAPLALRNVFNGVHPPLHLADNLQKPQTQATLRRLKTHNIIDDLQWKLLFPQRKSTVISEKFDAVMLNTLLKYVSSLSSPYPNGWNGVPIHDDTGITADMTRVIWFRTLMASKESDCRLTEKEFRAYHQQISAVLDRLGGVNCRLKADRMARDNLDDNDQKLHIKSLLSWEEKAQEVSGKEREIEKLGKKRESGSHDMDNLTDNFNSFGDFEDEEISPMNGHQQDSSSQSVYTEKKSGTSMTGGSTSPSRRNYSPSRRKPSRATTAASSQNEPRTADMALHERNILLQFYKPLTENIKSEDVVGKLVQRGVLSHEEKNRISLAPRNLERMKLVLELIPKKNGNAFEKFLDVIKYKYTSLYDQLTKAKQAPFVEEKPDEMTQCANALRSHYIHMWSKLTPIPWHKTATTTFSDFYEAPYITDYNGHAYSIEELFDGHKKVEHPRKILIEGVSGTGKSFIGKHIAFKYTQGHDVFNKAEFRLLFYIDLRKMKGSLSEAILEQCLPASYSSSPEEITAMLESNQQDILFIFDGYEDLKTESNDIWEVIEKKFLPKCAVILMVNPELFNISFRKYFETKLTLLGLRPDAQEDLIRKYADITQHSHDTFTSLLAKLINEYDNTVRLLSLNPLCCLCLCLIIETQGSLEIHTLSSMLQNFALAIQKLNCQHRKVTIVNGNIPDDIQLAMSALEVTAFNTAIARDTVFAMDRLQTLSEYQTTENLFHFGLLETYFHHQAGTHGRGKEMVVFCNRLVQESLAARRLSQMELEDCVQYVEDLTTESHLAQIAVFYCGHHQYDKDLHLMVELFEKLGHKNRQHWKILPATTNGSLSSSGDLNQESEGRLEDFKLSLECLNESEGRREVIELITESLPRRLGARHKDFQTIQLIGGLAHVIMADTCVVSELDLRLDHVGGYQEHTMMQLADALEKSHQVSTLRIQWTREDLLASFLANVFGKNKSITTLKISDESKSDAKNISATIWSHLRSAGNRMIHIKDLAFNHCKNPALNSSLMRNLQGDFHTLNLKGCKIDLVGAQDLAARIEKSKIMQVLNLDSVKMSSADFLNVTYGLRLNRSVTDFSLIDNHFDNAKVAALTDGLKFNGTLKHIDLSHNTFSEAHCKVIGQALGANKSLSDVKMKDCKLSEDGARSLRKLKRDGVVLSGLGDKGLMSKYAFGPVRDLSASPDIEKKPYKKK